MSALPVTLAETMPAILRGADHILEQLDKHAPRNPAGRPTETVLGLAHQARRVFTDAVQQVLFPVSVEQGSSIRDEATFYRNVSRNMPAWLGLPKGTDREDLNAGYRALLARAELVWPKLYLAGLAAGQHYKLARETANREVKRMGAMHREACHV